MSDNVALFPFNAETPVGLVLQQLGFSMDRMIELAVLNRRLHEEVSGETPEVIPISEVIAAFMSEWRYDTGHRKKLATTSRVTYESVTLLLKEYLLEHGDGSLDAVTIYDHCSDFVDKVARERELSLVTRNKYAAIVRRFCWFVYENYLTEKPLLPTIDNSKVLLPQALSEREVSELLLAARRGQYGIRSHFFVQFLLATGLRRDEFRHVKLGDIHTTSYGAYVKVTQGKGQRERVVPVPEELMDLMAEYCRTYDITHPLHYLYGHAKNPSQKLSNSALSREFQTIAKRMPSYSADDKVFRFHLHTLRHTYAQTMLLADVQLRVIADLLGHTTVRTTQIYTKLNVTTLREAANPGIRYIGAMIARRTENERTTS